MNDTLWLAVAVLILGVVPPGSSRDDTRAERGRYLAERVAMCVQCHTPRNERGEIVPQRLFHGAPVPVTSPFPGTEWAPHAPRLAGLPGWAEEDFLTLLETGSRPSGQVPRPPMPPFRMSREDAQAVAAYLKSLR